MAWPAAARDHGTFCISCHTAVPYALARPALRRALGENAPSSSERRLLDNVIKRTRLWNEVKPFYNDSYGANKAAESRGTEAVLNALVIATYDATRGKLSGDARVAFDNMWALQRLTGDGAGSWAWLQLNNEPFEAHDSAYYGAALAAIAVGVAPDNYRSTSLIQQNLKSLHEYLTSESPRQSAINRAVLLWASAVWPGLLSAEQQRSIVNELIGRQHTDGGWDLASLVWTWKDWSLNSLAKLWFRSDNSRVTGQSDGYATALILFALEWAGLSSENHHLKRAIDWLVHNQQTSAGRWPAYSLNARHDSSSDTGLFMSDAATAYAVLALTQSHR